MLSKELWRETLSPWREALSLFILSLYWTVNKPALCLVWGEGNGNSLQCSCLETPRDGAWWAAVYGVSQSRTRLKWPSSSSSCPVRRLSVKAVLHTNVLKRDTLKQRQSVYIILCSVATLLYVRNWETISLKIGTSIINNWLFSPLYFHTTYLKLVYDTHYL